MSFQDMGKGGGNTGSTGRPKNVASESVGAALGKDVLGQISEGLNQYQV